MKNCEWLIYGFWSFVSVDTKRGKKRLNKLGFQKLLGKVGLEGMLHHQNSCWCRSEKKLLVRVVAVWLFDCIRLFYQSGVAEAPSHGGGRTDLKQLTSNSHTMSHSIIQESYRNHSPSERSCCIKGPSSSPGAIFNHPKALAHSSTAPRQGCRRGMQWLSFLLHSYHENGHSMLEQAVISIELNPRKIQGESRSEYCQSHVLSFCLKTQMLNLTLILPRIATACSNDFLIAAPTGSPRHWCRNLPGHLAAHRQVTSAVPPPRGSRWSICWYLEKKKGE